ncbi:uncharacterized protein LOC108595297 [Drosophila busckii]|uniref:uncharacterized protein LOC108595297 n=1 Tax=Drosophila busckii TaxID=30019 RepID=UPI00083F3BE4|nr:uncharacterized protein LOC108595297 [Drosophila busckii]
MTSIVETKAPNAALGEAVPIWFKIDWSNDVLHQIYRDWGTYYFNRRRETFALHYYNKALELNGYDYMTLYRRSESKRKAAQIEGALQDARDAAALAVKDKGHNVKINQQICDALFELNRFEINKAELHGNLNIFRGVRNKLFDKRIVVVDEVITDVTGEAMSLFFLQNKKIIRRVADIYKAQQFVDKRPLWKILRDQGKCDILSIPDEGEVLLSPLERARRSRAFNVIHQNYLNDSWCDVLFMKQLRKNQSLLLNQCKYSRAPLTTLSYKQYAIVKGFIKMLQSRSPIYFLNFLKFSNKKMLEKFREAFLYRIQYQTHRNMLADLKKIRKLRKEKNIKSLAQYVEKIMGEYYVTKTRRVMCWKFEFANEVYNTLALALSEQYVVPRRTKIGPHTLRIILKLPTEKILDVMPFVFGDRSTYQEGDLPDGASSKNRMLIARMEDRIRFANCSIEKCYLYHQIGNVHLNHGRQDECCFNARRAIKESRNCNSIIWRFLSQILIVKANTMQHKLERTKEALDEIKPMAMELKSANLIKFIEFCLVCNYEDMHRKSQSLSSSRASKASGSPSNSRSHSKHSAA